VLRALVVDDSSTYRRALGQSLRRVGVTEVSVAGDLKTARAKLEREPVDVVTIDVVLHGESGLDLLAWLSANRPSVIAILVTAGSEPQACLAVDGLLLGAAGLIVKPTGPEASAQLDAALADTIAAARYRMTRTTTRIPRQSTTPLPSLAADLVPAPRDVVAIGASTGGPPAVLQFLSTLPADWQTPVVITQHMPALHVPHFAASLAARTALAVAVAVHGERLAPRRIYLAPGGAHLRVVRQPTGALILVHDHGPEEHYCRPAVDPMFRSIALACGAAAIGVVLTGMGSDGALGALAMREQGAPILVQDKASSVVWGMPGAVVSRGAADVVASIAELVHWVDTLDAQQPARWRSA
jgi:two-component system chemotaxis response regulator CheB